jgi:hypothetical protein
MDGYAEPTITDLMDAVWNEDPTGADVAALRAMVERYLNMEV